MLAKHEIQAMLEPEHRMVWDKMVPLGEKGRLGSSMVDRYAICCRDIVGTVAGDMVEITSLLCGTVLPV